MSAATTRTRMLPTAAGVVIIGLFMRNTGGGSR